MHPYHGRCTLISLQAEQGVAARRGKPDRVAALAIECRSSDAVHEVTRTMKDIEDSSQRISEIIHVIDSMEAVPQV